MHPSKNLQQQEAASFYFWGPGVFCGVRRHYVSGGSTVPIDP